MLAYYQIWLLLRDCFSFHEADWQEDENHFDLLPHKRPRAACLTIMDGFFILFMKHCKYCKSRYFFEKLYIWCFFMYCISFSFCFGINVTQCQIRGLDKTWKKNLNKNSKCQKRFYHVVHYVQCALVFIGFSLYTSIMWCFPYSLNRLTLKAGGKFDND